MDKFLTTDKDNVFVAWKVTTVDQMSYVRDVELKYELETVFLFSCRCPRIYQQRVLLKRFCLQKM